MTVVPPSGVGTVTVAFAKLYRKMRFPVWVIDCKAKQGWCVIEPSCVYNSTGQDVKEVVSNLRDRDYIVQIERKPKRDNIPQRCRIGVDGLNVHGCAMSASVPVGMAAAKSPVAPNVVACSA